MLAAPAIADSPDTQLSAGSGISQDLSQSSWREVGHAVWSKDGEKKRSSSASLPTPRRSVKGVMSPARKEKGRSKSPALSSPSKITQENKTLRQEVEEAKRNLAVLQESYERDDQGNVTRIQELERRAGMSEQQVAHILKKSVVRREAAQYIDIQRGKTRLSEDQAQHLVKIYGEYQDEARLKVLEYEKRHQEMAATVDLLEHRTRCEEESSLISKNKAEHERRNASSEIAQYQSVINSYQVKITTDSRNEENTIRGLRERLETALLPQPTMAIDNEPHNTFVNKTNVAIRYAEQEAHCARVAVSERDEMRLIGQRAVQERDAKMNEEIRIARERARRDSRTRCIEAKGHRCEVRFLSLSLSAVASRGS